MKIGRLEIAIWKDTGTPRFRIWVWRGKSTVYRWIFKILSYYTLWVSFKKKVNLGKEND